MKNKLAIISHTPHYLNKTGELVGWGPTIKEISYLTEIFDTIYHIAPLNKEKAPLSALSYKSNKIKFVALKPSGGKNIEKLSILFTAPINIYLIHQTLKKVDIIQFRAPTGMGIYVLPYLKFINRKKYWVKYAGNWIAKDLPLGNRIQRFWLKNIISVKNIVTVNGKWKNERKNIITFENPTLTAPDRAKGKNIINNKVIASKPNFCFVGALNRFKGVDKILEAFALIKDPSKIDKIYFVGDGDEREKFEELSKQLKVQIIFHGFLAKDKIGEIYKDSHFIILPSKSEGFPKVIGEGMNYGCIPIVSNISCIDQYIKNGENGYLIQPNTPTVLSKIIEESLDIKRETYIKIINLNYDIASKFTYNYFLNELKNKIL